MNSVITFSEAGIGHKGNEDAADGRCHPTDEACYLCTLADGQGGQAGGAAAAKVACQTAMAAAIRFPPKKLAGPATWLTALRSADEAVNAAPDAGYTTLVGFCLAGEHLCGASNGDSAVLVVAAGGRVEELTRHQAKNPPVGSGFATFVAFAARLVKPWVVLAMSDGVWKYVGWDRITEMVTRLRGQALVDSLQAAARLPRNGRFQDDFTLVLVQSADE
jgi:serine/threonine protein phosphatase PrpC